MSDQEKNQAETASEKKQDKKQGKKPGLGKRLGAWWREMRSELKKVVWPTPKQVLNNSIIVVIAVVVVGAVIALFDWGAQSLVMAIINAFH